MKRTLGLLSALALSSSLALGSVGAAEAAPATKVLTKPQLRSALLTVKDLPRGFRIDHSSSSSDSGDDPTITGGPGCDRAIAMFNTDSGGQSDSNGVADVKRDFAKDHGDESLELELTSYRSAKAVSKDFTTNVPILRSCHQLTFSGDGVTFRMNLRYKLERVHGARTFLMRMFGHYRSLKFDGLGAISQQRNNEVSVFSFGMKMFSFDTMLSAADRSAMVKKLLGTSDEKLSKQLR